MKNVDRRSDFCSREDKRSTDRLLFSLWVLWPTLMLKSLMRSCRGFSTICIKEPLSNGLFCRMSQYKIDSRSVTACLNYICIQNVPLLNSSASLLSIYLMSISPLKKDFVRGRHLRCGRLAFSFKFLGVYSNDNSRIHLNLRLKEEFVV